MSGRPLGKIERQRRDKYTVMEHDVVIIEAIAIEDAPLHPDGKVTICLADGRKLEVPVGWVRRREIPKKRIPCPNCGENAMTIDYFWRYWTCELCNWRIPA